LPNPKTSPPDRGSSEPLVAQNSTLHMSMISKSDYHFLPGGPSDSS
jgi:hypothetical protein